MVHHGGEFDAVPDVHLQDVQHLDQFIRWKLGKKKTNKHMMSQKLKTGCVSRCIEYPSVVFTVLKMPMPLTLAESPASSLSCCFPRSSSSGMSSSSVYVCTKREKNCMYNLHLEIKHLRPTYASSSTFTCSRKVCVLLVVQDAVQRCCESLARRRVQHF